MTDNQLHQLRILQGEQEDWEGLLAESRGKIIELDVELAAGYAGGELLEEDAVYLRSQINMLFLRQGRIYRVLKKIHKEMEEIGND